MKCIATLLLVQCFYIFAKHADASTVSYYVNLINSEVDKAFTYQQPVDNSKFSNGGNLQPGQDDGFQYDFIVVGGGSAGAPTARRLSDYGWRVLLLDAGGNETEFSEIPGTFRLLQYSDLNWGYYTTPQTHACQAMVDKKCAYPRGKVLGGSGAINAMMHIRSSEYDHSRWRAELGITGWSFQDVLPYYIKLENCQSLEYTDPGYRGYHGPVHIDYARPSEYTVNTFLEANAEMGSVNPDYNGKTRSGAAKTQYTKQFGRRGSTNKYYLRNTNVKLHVVTQAYVTDLVFNTFKRVVGVNYVKGGFKYVARSKFEVILSAGSINTPQILMHSGIGPKSHLEAIGIPVLVDLPVGQGLQDHIGFQGMNFETDHQIATTKTLEEHVWEYLSGTGRLTETNLEAVNFLSSVDGDPNPDIEIIMLPIGIPVKRPRDVLNLGPEALTAYQLTPDVQNRALRMIVMPLHPKSRGSVTLKSNNVFDFPNIDPNSLSDPADMAAMLKGIDYIIKLLDTEAFKAVNAKLIKQVVPACASLEYKSPEFWTCMVHQMSHTIYHPIGTCRMGTDTDPATVVDHRLRVKNVKGLRVADVSVVPLMHSGHTAALATMIGERAADFIEQEYYIFHILGSTSWFRNWRQ